jgi:hypothetical protein
MPSSSVKSEEGGCGVNLSSRPIEPCSSDGINMHGLVVRSSQARWPDACYPKY